MRFISKPFFFFWYWKCKFSLYSLMFFFIYIIIFMHKLTFVLYIEKNITTKLMFYYYFFTFYFFKIFFTSNFEWSCYHRNFIHIEKPVNIDCNWFFFVVHVDCMKSFVTDNNVRFNLTCNPLTRVYIQIYIENKTKNKRVNTKFLLITIKIPTEFFFNYFFTLSV